MLKTGRQYTPVDSSATWVMPKLSSQSANSNRSWPLGLVALGGAVGLLALDIWAVGWAATRWPGAVPWGLFPLFAGLLLLVAGAERAGVFAPVVLAIATVGGLGGAAVPAVVLGLAVVANLVNNLPAALVAATALGSLPGSAARGDLVAAVLIGVDLGPNLTPIGALSTLLWLLLLRRRGVQVSALAYLRVAMVVTVPALLAAAGGLWLVARLLGDL